jgi:hypothetical protein
MQRYRNLGAVKFVSAVSEPCRQQMLNSCRGNHQRLSRWTYRTKCKSLGSGYERNVAGTWNPQFARDCFISFSEIHGEESLTHSFSHVAEPFLRSRQIVQLLKNFTAFYGTRKFIAVLIRALHWSLSRARSIQSIPSHFSSLTCIYILSTHPLLGLSSGLFPSGFPTNIP